MEGTSKTAFLKELATALSHLYDPATLRQSLLLVLFDIERDANPIFALRDVLTGAIQAQKPNSNVPPSAGAWQIYSILNARYVDQEIQRKVAGDLGMSVRQLRRKEKLALQVLADHLIRTYHLEDKIDTLRGLDQPELLYEIETVPAPEHYEVGEEQELDWLEQTQSCGPVDLPALAEGVVETVAPMAISLGVTIKCNIPESSPPVFAHLATVRQALIHVISTIVGIVPQGAVYIDVDPMPGYVRVRITFASQTPGQNILGTERFEILDPAVKLLQMSRGVLEAFIAPQPDATSSIHIILPTFRQVRILVIDDNPEILTLVKRYLTHTRYEFHGTSDSETALEMARQLIPDIVLLDVIMPGFDGWELVGQLREHPATGQTRIIVCTILPQSELASVLGAADFIRKPIRRKELLSVLDRQTAYLQKGEEPSA